MDVSIKRCCNTCQDVREAYNAQGWVFDPANVDQCKREGITSTHNNKEGCQIFGTIEVNKIAGNFHIALGQSFEKHHAHSKFKTFLRNCFLKKIISFIVHDINLGELISVII